MHVPWKRINLVVTLMVCSVFCACAPTTKLDKFVPPKDPITDLNLRIESILEDSTLYQSRTGLKVVFLQTGDVLYEKNSHLLFHPASNEKLLTTAAALKKLGPDFAFRTTLSCDTASFMDSTLAGNLYLKGFADPSLATEDLWWMVRKLKELGLKRITSDLICDESYLDDVYFGSGWMWDDVSSKYWPPIGALTVNRNCVNVTVAPGVNVGDSLRVRLDPPTDYMKIENHGVTVAPTDTTMLEAFEVERKWRERENIVKIEGGLAPGTAKEDFIIEVVEPALYTGTLFTELLSQEGIRFSGTVSKGVLPDTTTDLVAHRSAPLTNLVAHTNKESDNLYAELLLKTLGAEIKGEPGTGDKGISVIYEFLHEIGLDSTTFEVADGSGVSRYNVISPNHIIELLKAMHEAFQVQAEFKASLPIAGVDGTLENRMQGTAAEGILRAKTGTLRGVSSLSGYTTTADDELLAFSIMTEHFTVSTSKIKSIEDQIGVLLSGFSRKPMAEPSFEHADE